jgi:hypothetical protein
MKVIETQTLAENMDLSMTPAYEIKMFHILNCQVFSETLKLLHSSSSKYPADYTILQSLSDRSVESQNFFKISNACLTYKF